VNLGENMRERRFDWRYKRYYCVCICVWKRKRRERERREREREREKSVVIDGTFPSSETMGRERGEERVCVRVNVICVVYLHEIRGSFVWIEGDGGDARVVVHKPSWRDTPALSQ